jgi:beta-glucanase (GH16 family)
MIIIGLSLSFISQAQVGQIIWEENFNTLDTDIWNITTGDGCPDLCGWGNEELEYYHQDNVTIEEIAGEPGNYALVLEVKNESIGGSSFTSGKVTTENKIAVKYGMIEVRMKAPDVEVGLWPAVWLLGTNHRAIDWPRCGEIDLMEMGQSAQFRSDKGLAGASPNEVSGSNLIWYSDEACASDNQSCAASISYDNYYCTPYEASAPLNNRFVTYRLYWDDKEIKFTVEDNGIIHNMYTGPFPIGDDAQEFHKPFYLLLNLAVGGSFTDAATPGQVTAPLPGKMYVDYIRIRKWNGKGEVTTPSDIMANAGGNLTVADGETITLDGAGSYGNITSYEWEIDGSVISTELSHSLVLPMGVHKVKLTVSDADGNSVSDEIIIQVGSESIGEILWEENFDTFNSEIWNSVTGDGCDEGSDLCGWGNAELEYYHPDNVSIEEIAGEAGNNALVLEARNETMGSSSFTSGKITTENKLAIKYGVIEVRMKVPDLENGLWPAAWMLGINHRSVGWPACGEMDMMEMGHSDTERERQGFGGTPRNNYVGANLIWYESGACAEDNPTCAASIAYDTWYDQPYASSSPLNERFVIYRTYWDENEIRLTVEDNGVEYDLYTDPFPISDATEAFRKPFYFILNLAVGGHFTGLLEPGEITAPMPGKMYVDYVRVRKWKGKGEVAFIDGNSIANAGPDQSIVDEDRNGTETVTLDGSYSYGNIVSYEWSEGGAILATGANPILELSTGNHFITLTTTDIDGFVATDEVMIDIREIIWEENFSNFDSDIWNMVTGDGCPDLCGWGNDELEYYQQENVYTEEITGDPGNYALVLEAKNETVGSSSFTSGKVTTQDKMSLKYGLVEVRMQVPDLVTGLWPAVWMLGINHDEVGWPACGEVDIMEMGQNTQFKTDKGLLGTTENDVVGANLIFYDEAACSGENTDCAASISYDNYYCTPYKAETPLNDRFVTYRTYWDDMHIRFTVEDNGREYDLYTSPFPIGSESSEFHKPFYFLLNLAVGGRFTDASNPSQVTAPLPGKMLVDYVRIMKWNGKGEVAFANGLTANAGTDILVIDKDGDKSETVTLDGTDSNDHDGTITSYSWTENGSEIATGITPSVNFTRSSHKVFLTVTDNEGNTETDSVMVVVSGGGLAPTAIAGNDTTLYDDNNDDMVNFSLNGSDSFDSNDTIIAYSWIENDIEIATGVNPPVNLSTGIHTITLIVYNSDSLTNADDIIITVIDPDNQTPIANAGPDQSVDDDNGDDMVTVTLDASASSDSDGTIKKYSWRVQGVEFATGSSPTLDMSTGVYTIILEVTDDDGVPSSDTVLVSLIDPDNVAPFANAGTDTILIDEDLDGIINYTLNATTSFDSDGTIESYSWIENNIEIASGESFSADLLLGAHTIVLVAVDDDGVSSTDTVNIKVNQLPVAIAGTDIQILDTDLNGSETVNLNGSASYDSYGTIVNYSWIADSTVIASGNNVLFDFAIGTHVLSLEVTDDDGFSASDEMIIIIVDPNNQTPIANAGPDIVIYDEDNDGSELYTLDASGSTDAENAIYSYTWFENNIELANGLSPEISLRKGVHNIILEVIDNQGAIDYDTVLVSVNSITCDYEACTGEFTSQVISSDASNTSITFVPGIQGYGDATCLLYYSTTIDGAYPGYNVTPNEPFVMTNVSNEQTVYFYYTYSRTDGPENSTYSCKDSFIVGGCGIIGNQSPIAMAGSDKLVSLPTNSIILDGSASYDPDLDPITFAWAKISGPSVTMSNVNTSSLELSDLVVGTYVFSLTVTDNENASDTNEVTVIVIEQGGDVNLALNKNTMTSSDENGETPGSAAVDGDPATRWSSAFSDPQWIYVDLGDSYELNRFVLTWEAAYATAYEIQISDDASSWTTIFTETSGDGDTDILPVSVTGRYIRIYGTTRATPYGYSLYEIEVYGAGTSIGTDATLSNLLMDGVSIDSFRSDFMNYTVILPAGTTVVPTITATTTDPNAELEITPTFAIPGTTIIVVTAEDGNTTETYFVNFEIISDCFTDIDNSGETDVDDLKEVIKYYGTVCNNNCPPADVDNDGVIGVDDLKEVIKSYGMACE